MYCRLNLTQSLIFKWWVVSEHLGMYFYMHSPPRGRNISTESAVFCIQVTPDLINKFGNTSRLHKELIPSWERATWMAVAISSLFQ